MAVNTTISLDDASSWTKGAYLAYLSPWGAGSLVRGVDYWDKISFSGDLFPNSATMSWKWPEYVPVKSGVYNFNAIDFGNYYGTKVQSPIQSLQVSKIGALSQAHNLTLGGDSSKYDVITDFFLTERSGDFTTMKFEVQVFLHTPAYSATYVKYETQLGTYTDAQGRAWTMALDKEAGLAPDILIMPKGGGDVLSGSIDIKAMLDWLTVKGVITGNEYFNGLGMGAEVRQGTGSLAINKFAVDYAAKTAPVVTPASPVVVNHDPVIDSNGGGASAALSVNSGTKVVTTVHASDADGTVLIYTIKGGADAALFVVDAKSGALSFKDAPSYGAPKDAGRDNIYNVTVQASDGKAADNQNLDISVVSKGSSAVFADNIPSSKTVSHTTDHYDTAWKMTRTTETDVIRFDGVAQTVGRYDASGKIVANTLVTNSGGQEKIQHFDAKWIFKGEDIITYGLQTTTDHYDFTGKATSHDVFYFDNGRAIEKHYDASSNLVGTEIAYGSVSKKTVDYYDGSGNVKGHDNIISDGFKLTTQHHDANWKYMTTDVEVLASAQVLNHDIMKAWLLS